MDIESPRRQRHSRKQVDVTQLKSASLSSLRVRLEFVRVSGQSRGAAPPWQDVCRIVRTHRSGAVRLSGVFLFAPEAVLHTAAARDATSRSAEDRWWPARFSAS